MDRVEATSQDTPSQNLTSQDTISQNVNRDDEGNQAITRKFSRDEITAIIKDCAAKLGHVHPRRVDQANGGERKKYQSPLWQLPERVACMRAGRTWLRIYGEHEKTF